MTEIFMKGASVHSQHLGFPIQHAEVRNGKFLIKIYGQYYKAIIGPRGGLKINRLPNSYDLNEWLKEPEP